MTVDRTAVTTRPDIGSKADLTISLSAGGFGWNYWLSCVNPQIAINVATGKTIHDANIGTLSGPTCTGHCFNALVRFAIAATEKINAEMTG